MKHAIFILLLAALLHSTFFIHHSYAFKLPDTGQSKCYEAVDPYAEIPCAGTGQDGAYNINPMSFTDNGNGTVTDNNTGLIWQKCSVGQKNDATCSGVAATFDWYQASGNNSTLIICGALTLGGSTDWRLPSIYELTDIVDYSTSPAIQQTWFPNTVAGYYWTSTRDVNITQSAWSVHFGTGYAVTNSKYNSSTGGYPVRCVRGGQ